MPFVRRHRSYYKYQDWTQPILTANGTNGGNSFACFAGSAYSSTPAYYAFNDNVLNGWASNSVGGQDYIGFYNPEPLMVTNINYTNYEWVIGGWEVYGSNDNTSYELLAEGTNTTTDNGLSWDMDLSSNKKAFKYYKIVCLTTIKGQRVGAGEIKITAKLLGVETTAEDADYYIDSNKMYTPVRRQRTYYKYGDTDLKIDLSKSNNTSYISNGAIDIQSVTAWSTTQTYKLKNIIKDNVLRVIFSSGFMQSNAGCRSTITAITDSQEVEILNTDWGYGKAPNEVFDFVLPDIKNISGFKIYILIYRASDQYCYGSVKIDIYQRSAAELNVDGEDTYEDWTQPVLTANGVMGGDKFAVSSNVAQYSGQGVYRLFDGSTSGCFHSTSGVTTGYIDLYNPKPLKITNILVNNQNASGSANRASTSGKVYGSSNGSDWELITEYTNSVQGINEQWSIDLSSNTKGYKYYRIESTAGGTGGYWTIGEFTLTAQELKAIGGTVEDADFYKNKILTYTPIVQKTIYYKYGTEPNVTIVGAPVFQNNTEVKGIDADNYITTPKSFTSKIKDSTWELVLKINNKENRDYGLFSTASDSLIKIYISAMRFVRLSLSSNGTSFDICDNVLSDNSVAKSRDRWIKLSFDGSKYVLSVSSDGVTYTPEIVVNSTQQILNRDEATFIGRDSTSYAPSHIVYLAGSYIKINDKIWWRGTNIVDGTSTDYDYFEHKTKIY